MSLIAKPSSLMAVVAVGNESVPTQLAQFSVLKYAYICQIKYTEAILSNNTRKLLWFEISKMLIAV